jgi:hypothetical protein
MAGCRNTPVHNPAAPPSLYWPRGGTVRRAGRFKSTGNDAPPTDTGARDDPKLHRKDDIMKNTTRIARLILAGTTAVLLSHTPGIAQTFAQTAYDDMIKNLTAGLMAIQVPADELTMLPAAQLAQIAAILDGKQKDVDKKAAAETVFRDTLHPTRLNMGAESAVQLQDQLKTQLAKVGLAYPTDRALTLDQVQKLLAIFAAEDASDATDAAAVLSDINAPGAETMGNAGAVQLKEQLYADMAKVGVAVPDGVSLTFDQVIELTAVFDRKVNDAEKATAAKAILAKL